MGCACRGRSKAKFLWYDPDQDVYEPTVYRTEVEAKAKQMRRGGYYVPYDGSVTIGTAIDRAETARAQMSGA